MTGKASVLLVLLLSLSSLCRAQATFTEFTISSSTAGPSGLYACDLDEDGDLDLLAAVNEGNYFAWFRNDGGNPVNWTRLIIQTGMTGAHSIHANDIDGDGDLDVVGSTYGSSIYWFRNDGGDPLEWTSFTITSSFTQAHEVYTVDIDNDGDIDVLGASSGQNRISLWYNLGGDPVEWSAQILDESCDMAKSVRAADFDGDGKPDVVSAALLSSDVYWYGNGGGTPIDWTPHRIDLSFGGAHYVYPVDLDKDGHLDIVGAGYTGNYVAWWHNNGGNPPTFSRQLISTVSTNACVAKAADIDLDGNIDVVATEQGSNTVVWFRNTGGDPINWERNVITHTFSRPWPLELCDLDGDGDVDIFSASSYNGSNEVKWWRNDLITSGVGEIPDSSNEWRLGVYPNPSNASTTLSIQVERTGRVTLAVFDLLGREVARPVDQSLTPGVYNVPFVATDLPSGSYFLRMQSTGFSQTKRLMLVR